MATVRPPSCVCASPAAPPNGREAEDPQPTGIAVNGEVEDQPGAGPAAQTCPCQAGGQHRGRLPGPVRQGLDAHRHSQERQDRLGRPVASTPLTCPQGQTVLSDPRRHPSPPDTRPPSPAYRTRTRTSRLRRRRSNAASKTLDLGTGEWMQCTMVNTALPGQVVWSKVDEAGKPWQGPSSRWPRHH